jgi:hypothetical protein
MCVALAALVLAATGGAGAAVRDGEHLINGRQIKAHSITGRDLAKRSVGSAALVRGAVTSGAIASNAVTGNAIATGAVGSTDLAPGAVSPIDINVAGLEQVLGQRPISPNQIPSGAITTDKLADFAVESGKIDSGAVTTLQLGNQAVTHAKLADGAVTNGNLVDGAVTNAKLADGSVTQAKLAPLESTHYIGTGSNPGFDGNADNCSTEPTTSEDCFGDGPAGYYVDQDGLVHLVGRVNPSTTKATSLAVFDLPANLRPANNLEFVTSRGAQGFSEATGSVLIGPNGTVATFDPETWLDGIVFRPGE